MGAFLVAAFRILAASIRSKGADPIPKILMGGDTYVQSQNARVNASALSGPRGELIVTTQELVEALLPVEKRATISAPLRTICRQLK